MKLDNPDPKFLVSYYSQQQDDRHRMYGDVSREFKQKRRLEMLSDAVAEVCLKTDRVLDLGCGDGWAASQIFTDIYFGDYTGVDLSTHKLSKIECRLSDSFVILADAATLPISDATYDLILISELLEHIVDVDALLSEAHRVLKSSGTIIISAPLDSSLQKFLLKLKNNWGSDLSISPEFNEHIQLFTIKSLIGFVCSNGFRVQKLHRAVFNFPLMQLVSNTLGFERWRRLDGLLSGIPLASLGWGGSRFNLVLGCEYIILVVRKQ